MSAATPETHPHLVMAMYGALHEALPSRVSAHDGGTSALVGIGGTHPRTGEAFVNLTNEGCGWGGRPEKDGNERALHSQWELCTPANRDPRAALSEFSMRRWSFTKDRPVQGNIVVASVHAAVPRRS